MAKFRDVKTLRKFASVYASIHNHFNQDRHLKRHDIFKQNRSAALAQWRQLATRASRLWVFWRPIRTRLAAPDWQHQTGSTRLAAPDWQHQTGSTPLRASSR
jgi:hypothetical protein